jgi:hypothetical protein
MYPEKVNLGASASFSWENPQNAVAAKMAVRIVFFMWAIV